MSRRVLSICAALLLSACAAQSASPPDQAAAAPAERDCFNADFINGYSYIDEHSLSVRVGANRRYIFATSWNARDLDWSMAIAVRSTANWICTGNGLGVTIIGGDPQRSYPITAITRALEPAPEAAPAVQGS